MDLCPAISSLSAGIIGRIRHKSGVSKGQVVPRCALPEAIVTPTEVELVMSPRRSGASDGQAGLGEAAVYEVAAVLDVS